MTTTYTRPNRLHFFADRFKGQVIGITGAGKINNLGYTVAERALHEGADVALYDTHMANLMDAKYVLDKIKTKGKVYLELMDVTKSKETEQTLKSTVDHLGRLDAIVNCAGITGDTGKPIEDSSDDIFDNILKANLYGSRNITKAAIPIMKQQGYGRILLVASIAGVVGNPNMVGYATSKAGVVGIVKSVGEELSLYAREYPNTDITINGIAPVVIQTGMVDQNPQSVIDSMRNKIPMGRFATLDEFAAKALYIISPENSGTQGFVEDLSLGRRRQ